MGDTTGIEWTDATWNPVRGCTRVSPGCGGPGKFGGCYAEKIAARFSGPGQPFEGFAEMRGGEARWTGKLALIDDKLAEPLRWKKPRRIFVNSMSDLFHETLPDEAIDRVFAVMALAPQHTFQVLTKRPERMRAWFHDRATEGMLGAVEHRAKQIARSIGKPIPVGKTLAGTWPWPHVWLGISAERQQEWDERKEHLRATPAAVRFASFEPLLGPIVERRPMSDFIQWAVVGGESGRNARPMHPDWARSLRDQCAVAGIPFLFKQWGEWAPTADVWFGDSPRAATHTFETTVPFGIEVRRVGKKAAGRLLDGVEHNEFPETLR